MASLPVYRATNEDVFLQILAKWPVDEHLDERKIQEKMYQINGCSMVNLQHLMLELLDNGILRMDGFMYFRKR